MDNVTLDDDYKLFGIFHFIDAFGGLKLQIANGTTLDENNNPVPPVGYAVTQNANLILLWDDALLKTDDSTRGYPLHTAPNLVHEFGHVIDLRTDNTMYGSEWQSMRNEFTALIFCGEYDENENEIRYPSSALGFDVGTGWNINNRQNTLTSSAIDNCATVNETIVCNDPSASIVNIICLEMELERIADMFLFWIYSDIPGYEFDIINGSSFIADRANAMYSFANGGEEWSRNNTTLTPRGFLSWVIQAGE